MRLKLHGRFLVFKCLKIGIALQKSVQNRLQFLIVKRSILNIYLYKTYTQMRNTELKKKRDKRMVETFYKLYDIERLRLDDVLKELSEDIFFLSVDYIYNVIFYTKENKDYYDQLVDGVIVLSKQKARKAV